jgi:cytochrome c-type biogenesis protein CcmH/NrfG
LYGKSVEANPTDADSWYQLGLLAYKIEAFDKAIEAFAKVTELQPANAKAWAALSRAYARKSEASEGDVAAECVKKATEAFQMYEALQNKE